MDFLLKLEPKGNFSLKIETFTNWKVMCKLENTRFLNKMVALLQFPFLLFGFFWE